MEKIDHPQNPAQKLHRFPKVWMTATIVIVAGCLITAGVYLQRAYKVSHKPKSNITAKAPATAKAQAAQASQELKSIDLASLKSSISDVKAVISSFSK